MIDFSTSKTEVLYLSNEYSDLELCITYDSVDMFLSLNLLISIGKNSLTRST